MAEEDDKVREVSPDAGPPATGERADHRMTAPGVEMPDSAERAGAPADDQEDEGARPGGEAPDEGAAREREDDRS